MKYLNESRNPGFILMLVLSILAMLLILVVQLIETVALERQLSADYINKVRSRLLAHSGIEYIKSQNFNVSNNITAIEKEKYFMGMGTYARDGDGFIVSSKDTTGMININDGIKAGHLERGEDAGRTPIIDWEYNASEINPWNKSKGVDQDSIDKNLADPNKSGLINLRLRRILNAYGDCHFYESELGAPSTYSPGNLENFHFTSSAYKQRGEFIGYNVDATKNGLGDEIIHHRPEIGYKDIDEIKNIVNQWASVHITKTNYYTGKGFDTFFELIENDLSVVGYEDSNFYRLRTEIAATLDCTDVDNPYNTATSAYMWKLQNDYADCRFHPNYLDRFPIDLTDDSGNGTKDASGNTINVDNNLWAAHSVSLINLNMASRHVKAAVFYAPVNVSYLCEGAVTHQDDNDLRPKGNGELTDVSVKRGMGRSSIGVRGVCFNPAKMLENGVSVKDEPDKVQVNHFMSLKDAMTLSNYLHNPDLNEPNKYNNPIYNFDDFKTALIAYRQFQFKNNTVAFERAEQIPLDTSGNMKLPGLTDGSTYYKTHLKALYGYDTTIPYTYKPGDPEFDPHRGDVLWVSQYWAKSSGSGGEYEGGWFLDDYVERTLPHVFSCVRRIPGYLGAPMALTSPYMVVEPFAYKPDPTNIAERSQVRRTFKKNNGDNIIYENLPDAQPLPTMLGTQPKVSIEDLVTRHTLPKICFSAMGVFDVSSVGFVDSPSGERVSQSTIKASIQLFESKFFRTQSDFVSLIKKGIGTSDNQTDPDIVIGPEFKVLDNNITVSPNVTPEQRVQSDYWLSLGLADIKSLQMGKGVDPSVNAANNTNGVSVRGWDLYMEGDPKEALGGLGQTTNSNITTFLPSYGSTVADGTAAADAWERLYDDNLTLRPITDGVIRPYNTDFPTHGTLPGMPQPNLNVVDARKRVSFGSTLLKTGDMERASNTLWAQKDGHDLDPFGQGIFFGSSGHGLGTASSPDELNPTKYPPDHPNTFRDAMYWNLNNKLKSWSLLTSDPNAVDSITGNYKFAPDMPTPGSVGPFTDGFDVNPTGLSFHRSFFSAWFRIPTSYPFAHPVYFDRADWHPRERHKGTASNPELYRINGLVRNKRHLYKNIMALQFSSLDDWCVNRSPHQNDQNQNTQFKKGKEPRFDGGHNYFIQVGYYSGFDRFYSFEHGIRGTLDADGFKSGIINPRPSSTKWGDGNHKHPLFFDARKKNKHSNYVLFGYTLPDKNFSLTCQNHANIYDKGVNYSVNMGFPTQSNDLNPYYGKTHAYFWDYDHLFPTPFNFEAYDEALPKNLNRPSWGGGSPDLGYHLKSGQVYDGTDTYLVQTFIDWKQDYGNSGIIFPDSITVTQDDSNSTKHGIEGGYEQVSTPPIDITGFPPQNNLLYNSYGLVGSTGRLLGQHISHDLRMNNSPECAPGSWHRVYAFWFLRFNPGQMGLTEDPQMTGGIMGDSLVGVHTEMGDTMRYGGSEWWDERYYGTQHIGTVLDRSHISNPYPPPPTLDEPLGMYLPHGGTSAIAGLNPGMTSEFPVAISRYAQDDMAITGQLGSEVNSDAAFDVDGLDQFGIWFRDDSNYTQGCSINGVSGTGADGNGNAPYHIKPQWNVAYLYRLRPLPDNVSNYTSLSKTRVEGVLLSIGDVQLRRLGSYIPSSGEEVDTPFLAHNHTDTYAFENIMQINDYGWKHYPGFRFDSSIDNVIFGYGSDISVPGQSYFRGLFHNANWLGEDVTNEDQFDGDRHPDEVRYYIKDGNEPRVNFELTSPTTSQNKMPKNSKVLRVGCRIYNPRDENYNYSELEFKGFHEGDIVPAANVKSSDNKQDHFYNPPVRTTDFRCQFQYTAHKPERYMGGGTDIDVQSTILNFNQANWSGNIYNFSGGDSFTNIPYIQEMMVQYKSANGVKHVRWSEN